MFRKLKPYQRVLDAVGAALFLALMFPLYGPQPAELVLILGMTAALALARSSPVLALGVAWVTALFQMYVAVLGPSVANLAILVVLFSTAAYGDRLVKWLGLGSVGVGALLGSVYLTFSGLSYRFGLSADFSNFASLAAAFLQFAFLFIAMLVLLGLPWTAGLLVRTRLAARQSYEARLAAQHEVELAEQTVIVEQERNRIARDMHDVVAHSLAVVIAQADGARYAHKSDPAVVDDALKSISSTAREALGDVRLLLGQLRHNQAEGSQPTLADLDRLLDQMRASGLTVDHTSTGEPLTLGTGQQLAVYRIVQEALTNALRHGDGSEPVVVTFEWTGKDLEVTITSTLDSSPRTGEVRIGHGLAGMRERAALAGGWLSAEPRGAHFIVTTSVPASEKAFSE